MFKRLLLSAMILLSGCDAPGKVGSHGDAVSGAAVVALPGGIQADRSRGEVRVPAMVATNAGWLEQMVCGLDTREHESLLVVAVRPSDIHAGLLLIGLEPGRPGSLVFHQAEGDVPARIERIPPTGARVSVHVRPADASVGDPGVPLSDWLIGFPGDSAYPKQPWRFGGSVILEDGTYLADRTGSIVGLVTFGDEVLGRELVRSGELEIEPSEWMARTRVMPEPGTKMVLVLRPWS